MLCDWGLTCELSNSLSCHVTEANHEDGLPDTQADSWGHTSVEPAQSVMLVDVLGRTDNAEVLWSVWIVGL